MRDVPQVNLTASSVDHTRSKVKYLWCTTNQTLPVILADGRKIAKYFSSANVPWLETLECVHLEPSVAHFVLNGSADALRVFVVGCHLAALAEILSCQGGLGGHPKPATRGHLKTGHHDR